MGRTEMRNGNKMTKKLRKEGNLNVESTNETSIWEFLISYDH